MPTENSAAHPAEAAIAALELQRAALGSAVVDYAIGAIRERLAREEASTAAATAAPRLRQVSVLFCDVVNSTAMLQSRSAEDALELVGRLLQRCSALVEGHGGRVLRYTGDGLKAAWGTGATREDDAERAVASGLALLAEAAAHAGRVRASHGIEGFALRVGVNTGPVVLGGGAEADNTAMGHVVHLAARLEQAAPAGQLLIGAGTAALVRGLFEWQALPPLTVKGNDEPLAAWRVLRTLPRGERLHERGLQGLVVPMLGRDAELAALQALLRPLGEPARDPAAPLAATVLADAGIGKSRLARELLATLPAGVQVLPARAEAALQQQPYALLRDLLARRLQIADDDSAELARAKLGAALGPLLGARAETLARRLGALLGFGAEGEGPAPAGRELRERGFAALRELLQAWAAQAPLLLLLDDLHWADEGSLDFLHELAARPPAAPSAPTALVMLARPALLERRPQWQQGAPGHTLLRLQALTEAQGQALAQALLARVQDVPSALRETLVNRAAGNPYFMEELLRMLVEAGAIDTRGPAWRVHPERLARLRLPETLVGVLQARLDALPADELAALQQASIVGPVFWEAALQALQPTAGAALPALQRRSLLQQHETSAFAHTAEHAFFHPLLHEVTYGTVLKAARREGHARAAQWLADRVAQRASEFLAVTAAHFEAAGNSEQALHFFDRAAFDASRRHVHGAVLALSERALAQPALQDPTWRYQLLMLRSATYEGLAQFDAAAEVLLQMHALAEATPGAAGERLRARLLATRALHADRTGQLEEAAALAPQAVAAAEACGCAPAAALAHGELAWLALAADRLDEAQRHLDAALPFAREAATWPAREGGNEQFELKLTSLAVDVLVQRDQLAAAVPVLQRGLQLAGQDSGLNRFSLLNRAGHVATHLGRLDEGRAHFDTALAVARELENPVLLASAVCGLIETQEFLGQAAAQQALAQEAEAVSRRVSPRQLLPHTLDVLAATRAANGDTAAARAACDEALPLLLETGQLPAVAGVLARRAALALQAGEHAAARDDVNRLLAETGPVRAHTAPAQVRAWQVLQALGDARAAGLLAQLRQRLQQLQDTLDEAGRQQLLQLPHWRAVARAAPGP